MRPITIRGATIIKVRRPNTYETKLLTPKAPPGTTTTLRLALWVMTKRDGRRLGRGKVFRPANVINAAIVQQTTLRLE
jgi:hypothetical protein